MARLPRLSYGFLSSSLDPINVKIPWQFSNQDGMFKMNYLPEKAMEDSLRVWAKTNKGEYIMDVNFGLDARRSLFLPSSLLKDTVLNNARQQLPIYFPKIKPTQIEILTSDDRQDISENSAIFIFDGVLVLDKNKRISVEQQIG